MEAAASGKTNVEFGKGESASGPAKNGGDAERCIGSAHIGLRIAQMPRAWKAIFSRSLQPTERQISLAITDSAFSPPPPPPIS